MHTVIHTVVRKLEWVITGIAGLAILIMAFLSLTNALGRTWFHTPIYGANEISSSWLLPALVLLAIPGAQVWKEHINVALFIEHLSVRSLAWTKVLTCVMCAAVSAAFAWYGFVHAVDQASVQATAGITSIPSWPAYYLVPMGFALSTLVFLADAWLGFKNPEHELNTGTGNPVAEIEV